MSCLCNISQLQIGKDFESKEMFDKASKIYEATILGAGPTKVAGVLGLLILFESYHSLFRTLWTYVVSIEREL